MSYAIMRLEKRKSNNIPGMENHNERKTDNHSNCNIDLEKKDLNYDLVQCDNYRKKIDEEINKRYSGKKAIRKDAVLCTEFLFTSDNKFFSDIGVPSGKRGITTLRIFLTIDAPFIFNVFRPFFIQKFSQVI